MKSPYLSLFFTVLGATTINALIPDPGNIYYGLARDMYGVPYQPGQDAKVQLVRIIGTVDDPWDNVPDDDIVIAESEILAPQGGNGSVNFVLRPSLDDGSGSARYAPAAARINDVVAIYVVDEGVRMPVMSVMNCAPMSDVVPVIGARGSINLVNVRTIDDYDANCLSDSWEYWFFGSSGVDPHGDEDGDGIDNLAEFISASNPLVFDALDLTRENAGRVLSKTGSMIQVDVPRQTGRTYIMEWSSDLKTWTAVPSNKLSGTLLNRVDTTGMGASLFFRYRVSRGN